MRYCLIHLGCKVNQVECDSFERVLVAGGLCASDMEAADLIIINTCTVTSQAEKKSRKSVRGALRRNAHACIVVTGCASAIDAQCFKAMDPRIFTVAKQNMEQWLFKYVVSQENDGFDSPLALPLTGVSSHRSFSSTRSRVGIKIQDGCDNACSYCIVRLARGGSISRPCKELLRECSGFAHSGLREMVLTGINLGSYKDNGIDLTALLVRLLSATSDLHDPDELPCRFRLSSIEPLDLDEACIDLLAHTDGRICRHLHIPLQSGSDRVLREMNRPYDSKRFFRLVDRIRSSIPAVSLTTDIIVGFPGESEKDFEESLAAARYCRFSKIHVFVYSRRNGTPAAERVDQIDPEVKARRAADLRALSLQMREEDFASRKGSSELALVEEKGKAMTESYFRLAAPPDARPSSLVRLTF